MAVVSMRKMSLVAHSGDRGKLLKIFVKSGVVEIARTDLTENTSYVEERALKEELEGKLGKLGFAVTFFRETQKLYEEYGFDKEKKLKLNFKKENRLVPLDEYYECVADETEIFATISEIADINSRLTDIKAERTRNLSLAEQLETYKDLEIPFSYARETKNTVTYIGAVSSDKVEPLKELLEGKAEYKIYEGFKANPVVIVAHKSDASDVQSALAVCDFVRAPFEYDVTCKDKLEELKDARSALEEESKTLVGKGMAYADSLGKIKVLYDYYTMEIAKCVAMENCPRTQKAFVMDCWIPKDKEEAVKVEIEEKCGLTAVFFRDPLDSENPPTLLKEDKFTNAFSGITEMFGTPGYRERDPNIFVAIYYFLFFGIMISDAGYGVIMAIACFLFLKIVKPVKNSGRMIAMFAFCGLSTVVWGALFGGWFAITLPEGSFLDKITWFNPLNEPLKMFALALGMGLLQIGTSFVLKGIDECKSRDPMRIAKGAMENFGWVITIIGIFVLSPKLLVSLGVIKPDPIPASFETAFKVGAYIAIAGFAILVVGGALGSKNPIKMLGGAFKNVYGAINVVSDTLSYSRLFGLGLTTGVIGYVINMLAEIIVNIFFKGNPAGWIVAVPVLIVGHVFNLAINLLGAYVHDARLQHIEFFGRFFEGQGHAFNPIGSKTKYTYLDN